MCPGYFCCFLGFGIDFLPALFVCLFLVFRFALFVLLVYLFRVFRFILLCLGLCFSAPFPALLFVVFFLLSFFSTRTSSASCAAASVLERADADRALRARVERAPLRIFARRSARTTGLERRMRRRWRRLWPVPPDEGYNG